MFAADLSWCDDRKETVGQRRQRRATKREGSITSSTSGSKKGSKTDVPKTSHHVKQPMGSITKTISFSSVKGSIRRPSTATSTQHLKAPIVTVSETIAPFRDPVEQPDYVDSAKLGRRLPSGASLDSSLQFVNTSNYSLPVRTTRPQPAAVWEERSSDFDATSPAPLGPHKAWSVTNQTDAENICQSYQQVKDEILALHNPEIILPQSDTTFVSARLAPPKSISDSMKYDEASVQEPVELSAHEAGRPRSVASHHMLSNTEDIKKTKYGSPSTGFDAEIELPSIFRATLAKESQAGELSPPVPPKVDSISRAPTKVSQWNPPESWDIVKSRVEIRKILDSDSSNDDAHDGQRQSTFIGSHFQRFVRRMESAGPRIILERLKEEWDLPGDRAMSDELQLEKHLWALTALQLQSMDRFARQYLSDLPIYPLPPITSKRRRKILELDGSIGTFPENAVPFIG
jgi:hypothetical protein